MSMIAQQSAPLGQKSAQQQFFASLTRVYSFLVRGRKGKLLALRPIII
ncbi:hypothetical protein [Chitinibacter sp. GC72]|nr:hypothetical protein [Chitinibacter sp. GC72]